MNWKKYRDMFENSYPSESQFIVGLDMGNATSSIAYFDLHKKEPEIIDISGGYGKPNIPTVVQYDADNEDWIFGEYALLNISEDEDIKISSIIDNLGKNIKVPIKNHDMELYLILSKYIEEIVSNCKNLNPNANVAGIVVLVPNYFGYEAYLELKEAFNNTKYKDYVITYSQDREATLSRYYYENEPEEEKIMLLDFGSRELRIGTYQIIPEGQDVKAQCLMSMYDQKLGESKIDNIIQELFFWDLQKNTQRDNDFSRMEIEQLRSFLYINKDLLFQKNIATRPIKLYYNFIHPPFQETYEKESIDNLLEDFKEDFKEFISEVLVKSASLNNNRELTIDNITKVICTGGGFEMLWAKELIREVFGDDKAVFFKNSKTVTAEGATIIAATKLNVIESKSIKVIDRNLLEADIGFEYSNEDRDDFYSVAEVNSFWWTEFKPCVLLVNKEIGETVEIVLMKRNQDGETDVVDTISIEGLPRRPKGTTKLQLEFNFMRNDLLKVTIEDFGFGEIFPKTDFKKDYVINID